MITVYTKASCGPCYATKLHLERRGLEFEEKNAVENIEFLKAAGYQSAPVVFTEATHWSGYRPDLLDAI